MKGRKIKRTYITKFMNNFLKDHEKNWPEIKRDKYREVINKLSEELEELSDKLFLAVKDKMYDRQGSLRAMYYYLFQYQNKIPVYYKEKIEENIKQNEMDLLTLHDEDSSRFLLNLVGMLFEYIIFDYYKRSEKDWDFSIFEGRPTLKVCFGQHHCTKDTTFRRTELVLRDFSSSGTKVLFLGDGDLCSLALSKASNFEVHMLDIDRDIIKLIESKNRGIVTHRFNLKRGLPKELENYFDAIVMDPFWEFSGVEMFFEPAYRSLKKKSKSRIYMSVCPFLMGQKKYGEIQKKILDKGLVFLEIIKHFNWYVMSDNKNYSEYLKIFDEVNKEYLKSDFIEAAIRLPVFFSDMLILAPAI